MFERRTYNLGTHVIDVEWAGAGWYAQRQLIDSIRTVKIADFGKPLSIVSDESHRAGFGTPFAMRSPDEVIR